MKEFLTCPEEVRTYTEEQSVSELGEAKAGEAQSYTEILKGTEFTPL
jgi:hypothetical protein